MTMHVDNSGAILPSENTSVSQLKKHIDMCHPFICDYVEDETVKNQFVSSKENMADPFTKNLSNGPFESLTSRYIHCEYDLKNNYHYFNHAESNHHT